MTKLEYRRKEKVPCTQLLCGIGRSSFKDMVICE